VLSFYLFSCFSRQGISFLVAVGGSAFSLALFGEVATSFRIRPDHSNIRSSVSFLLPLRWIKKRNREWSCAIPCLFDAGPLTPVFLFFNFELLHFLPLFCFVFCLVHSLLDSWSEYWIEDRNSEAEEEKRDAGPPSTFFLLLFSCMFFVLHANTNKHFEQTPGSFEKERNRKGAVLRRT
jgi:hypothetical protein